MPKLTMGIGAVGSIMIKYVHPSEHIRNKYTNPQPQQKLDGVLIVRLEHKKVARKDQECVVFRHDDFSNIELHAVK